MRWGDDIRKMEEIEWKQKVQDQKGWIKLWEEKPYKKKICFCFYMPQVFGEIKLSQMQK